MNVESDTVEDDHGVDDDIGKRTLLGLTCENWLKRLEGGFQSGACTGRL